MYKYHPQPPRHTAHCRITPATQEKVAQTTLPLQPLNDGAGLQPTTTLSTVGLTKDSNTERAIAQRSVGTG